MEERTQIKFNNPDIDGTPIPQLITLEQESPIEGTSERESGESFIWHKWLCTNNQYFMASDSLDGMLRLMPSKTGKPLKIEKVPNPKGGFPFFQINGMNKDQLIKVAANQASSMEPINPVMPPQAMTVPASNTDGAFARLEQKLDQVIEMLNKALLVEQKTVNVLEEELPF